MRKIEKHLCINCQDVCDIAKDIIIVWCKQYKYKPLTQYGRLMADMTVEK